MEIYKEILRSILLKEKMLEQICLEKLIHDRAVQALEKIREVLSEEEYEDPECFWRIEEIVRVFEELGSDAGSRHDYS